MRGMMGRLPTIGRPDAACCAVAVVSAAGDLGVRPLLDALASQSAAILLWHIGTGELMLDELRSALAQSPFRLQSLRDGDTPQRGIVYLAAGPCQLWFEGRSVRMEPLWQADAGRVDRCLTSLARGWGKSGIALVSSCPGGDGRQGMAAVRAAGGLGLELRPPAVAAPEQHSAAAERRVCTADDPVGLQELAVYAALPRPYPVRARRLFAIPRALLGAASAAVRDGVRDSCARGRLRVWLPGCKTGDMVYTMAMLLSDGAVNSEVPLKLQVFGTDQDDGALSIARAGRYPVQAALDMDPGWRARYTFDEGDTIRVSEALREMCIFSSHHLGKDPPLSRMDLVVCHGLFERVPAGQRLDVVDALHFSLRDRGLVLALDGGEQFPEDRFERTAEGYLRARPQRAKHLSPRPVPPRALQQGLALDMAMPNPAPASDETRHIRELRREQALAGAQRERADLQSFVDAIGLPILFCNHELRVVGLSAAACQAFGLSHADQGTALYALVARLPGGADIALAAERAMVTEETQDLTIQSGYRAYLVRLSKARRLTEPGVTIAFTDVSDFDKAQARAAAQLHQQAGVARLGSLALGSMDDAELFEEALGVLFGNISLCVAGVILERPAAGPELAVLASRGLGDDPLRLLHDMGEPAQLLDAVLERESPMTQAELPGPAAPSSSTAARTAPGSKPRSTPFASALPFVKGGIACPILNEGVLLGVIALYSKQPGLEAAEQQHFVQSVANVLGAAITRQRTRRRLALELEVSSLLASAADVFAAGTGISQALAVALKAEETELWARNREAPAEWVRLYPEAGACSDIPQSLRRGPLGDEREARVAWYSASAADGPREIAVPVWRRDQIMAVLRSTGDELRMPDGELGDGLRRIGFMLADFLERIEIHDALKRSEASYRRSSAEFEALHASLPVAVSIHDLDGSIRRANSHLGQLQSEESPRAAAIAQLYAHEAPQWIERVIASGEPIQNLELATSQAGDNQYWLCNFAPIRARDGAVLGASAVVQDITALKQVETSLREADKQKDDFLAILGHELRNPMAAIRNASELLSRIERPSPQLVRLQSILERQVAQTTKLIDGLLDVARVARGKVELQIAPVNVLDLVRQVVEDRRHQLGARAIDIRLPEASVWVAADRVRLVQILDNLMSNALKFTMPNGQISLEVRCEGARGRVRVSDDGSGIDPEFLPQIFEPFRQGRAAASHGRSGLGLGLALVKGLVELHGFGLKVHSEGKNRGAAFEIDFPLAPEPTERPPESRVDARPLSILLVEDNADIADTLAELLEESGHRIRVLRSAEEALRTLRAQQPDVVLCDIGLPGMDGLTLAARLRDDPELRNLKLVAMTGYGDATTRARIERSGFDRYLVKPVQLDALQRCLVRLAASPVQWINRR